MNAPAVGLATTLLAMATVAGYLRLARRRDWVDVPNHRSSHSDATPSSGGMAVMAALLPVLTVLAATAGAADLRLDLAVPLLCAAAVCAVGAWDDRQSLSAPLRLFLFIGLSLWLVVDCLAPATPLAWLGAFVLGVALAWLVNLYNFMDGIDGIAALQCVLTALAIGALGHFGGAPLLYTGSAAAVAGAYAAFLVYNWPPARLFMGDAGSLAAGLLLGWLGLWGWREDWLPVSAWILLLSPFLIDTGWTLLDRVRRGAPLAQAHREHLYQRLARHWASHRRVDLALLALHLLWLQPLAALAVAFPSMAQTFVAVGLFPQFFLIVRTRRLQ